MLPETAAFVEIMAHGLRREGEHDTRRRAMARSTLNTTGEGKAVVRKGHGTRALGPSDSTDSGSDIVGGPGLNRDDGLPLQQGTTSDPDRDGAGAAAGPEIGRAACRERGQ